MEHDRTLSTLRKQQQQFRRAFSRRGNNLRPSACHLRTAIKRFFRPKSQNCLPPAARGAWARVCAPAQHGKQPLGSPRHGTHLRWVPHGAPLKRLASWPASWRPVRWLSQMTTCPLLLRNPWRQCHGCGAILSPVPLSDSRCPTTPARPSRRTPLRSNRRCTRRHVQCIAWHVHGAYAWHATVLSKVVAWCDWSLLIGAPTN